MKSRKPIVAGNWKMNGDLNSNAELLGALRAAAADSTVAQVEIVVCPPYPYLAQAAECLRDTGIAWGAQDIAAQPDNGALTGEVSAAMLADLGCRWAIVGHSERRTLLGETDQTVATKAAICLGAGLGLVACVGETLAERDREATDAVLARQLDAIAPALAGADAQRVVIAYEPVWAIGTGRTASPEIAQQAHEFIRSRLKLAGTVDAEAVRIVYGGSVKAGNAGALFHMPDVDGGLIGGASLVADDFLAICRAAVF